MTQSFTCTNQTLDVFFYFLSIISANIVSSNQATVRLNWKHLKGFLMTREIDFKQCNDCLERCECVIYTVVYYFNDAVNTKASGNFMLGCHTCCKSLKINNIKRPTCRIKIYT